MHLIDCFIDALVFVRQQVELIKQKQHIEFESTRLNIEKYLAEKASLYIEGGYQEEHYDQARFAVVAFIDESILGSGWQHSREWSGDLLQKSYYSTANAGVEFFDRLASLNMIDPAHRDVREVYYYCLSMGFTGRYFDSSQKQQLERIKQDTFQLLMAGQPHQLQENSTLLMPSGYPPVTSQTLKSRRIQRTPFIYGGSILVLIIAYVAMKLDIVGLANHLVSLI
ncbi:type VI secretion system protein ImpK [Oceanospirillum multiglobuliferum]|uniref:Type IV / VI secretion system DotU domain-containing protein n=1 Tax=Oceanospirillum multiglobuliferum TaxID=64969 RepID=A0A1T4MT96_9GAMM|nr:type IVB secretion system protein IcmH/DotU [Oceanospirillum multiglobuliferum]OPX56901.1 hypothetical protein BTE48_00240 [Oceanospirillum multiglobuliferum]SJZ70044.1 type VI secretion system protein ImpK [Oceanospirillum multiglobuliferum]